MTDSRRRHATTLAGLLAGLDDAQGGVRLVFPDSGADIAHREIPRRAWGVAAALYRAGARPKALVGVLMHTGPGFPVAVFGVWAAGCAVTVLPVPPLPAAPDTLAGRLFPLADKLTHLLTDAGLWPVASALAELCPNLRVVRIDTCAPADRPPPVPEPEPADTAIVQFTSGSTARPKGVLVSHAAVLSCCAATELASSANAADVLVGWVPLFHDFGFITLLIGLWIGFETHLFPPWRFIRRPAEVLEYLARVGGTIFGGPNFAYDRISEVAAAGALEGLRLDRWRMAMNGGEPVKISTIETFARTTGLPASIIFPVYGMAEATMSVACPDPGAEPHMLWFDRHLLAEHGETVSVPPGSGATGLVSVGRPVPGMELRLVAPDGTTVPDGRVGDIELRGQSITSGYLDDPDATAAAFHDGWLRTGDLGVRVDRDLYVTGRRKDMIIVAGRNYFAEDVEDAIRTVPGLHRGRCVAVADPDVERIIVVGETTGELDDRRLVRRIRARATAALEIDAVDVHLVPPGTIPRITSGKWQRASTSRLIRELHSATTTMRKKV